MTAAMKHAMDETEPAARRSRSQYNTEHGIVPTTIVRAIMNINPASGTIDYFNVPKLPKGAAAAAGGSGDDVQERIAAMRLEMFEAAENLEFEKAARLRDELKKLEAAAGLEQKEEANGGFNPYASSRKRGSGTRKTAAKAGTGSSAGRGRRAKTR